MMRQDRLWQFGGALCAIVLLAFGWFFFIDPERQDANDIKARTVDANVEVEGLQRRLNQLRKDNEHLTRYKEQLKADLGALPTTDAAADLLRELQLAGELTGVTVSGVSVGTAADVKAGKTEMHALPVSLTVAGPTSKINSFLDQLQKIQPRAVLINAINITPSAAEGAGDRANTTINLQAFYAADG